MRCVEHHEEAEEDRRLRLIDTVAERPRPSRKTRRLSCDHGDAIDARWHREDAIAATVSGSSSFFSLSKRSMPIIMAALFSGVAENAG